MPVIAYLGAMGSSVQVDVCNQCHVDFLADCAARERGEKPEREKEWCKECTEKLVSAGIPMKKPYGRCACCRDEGDLIGEFEDFPDIKLCAHCVTPEGKLIFKDGWCMGGCQRWKKVAAQILIGKQVFNACRSCGKRGAEQKKKNLSQNEI